VTRQKLRPTSGENRQTDGGARHDSSEEGRGFFAPAEISSSRASQVVELGDGALLERGENRMSDPVSSTASLLE
jgi:hypothetical protein